MTPDAMPEYRYVLDSHWHRLQLPNLLSRLLILTISIRVRLTSILRFTFGVTFLVTRLGRSYAFL